MAGPRLPGAFSASPSEGENFPNPPPAFPFPFPLPHSGLVFTLTQGYCPKASEPA